MLVDTPGLHESTRRVMNQYMNKVALSSSRDADVILFVVEAMKFGPEDLWVWERVRGLEAAACSWWSTRSTGCIPRENLLPFLETDG